MAEISEKELEDYLYSIPLDYKQEHPIEVFGKCFRQVRIEGYGVIDLLYVDFDPAPNYPEISIVIVELKRGNIDLSALGQLCRYKVGIKRYFEQSKRYLDVDVRGILVGNDYSDGDICYAVDSMDWVQCWHYNLDLSKGISFEESSGWCSKSEDFSALDKLKKELLPEYIYLLKTMHRNCRKNKIIQAGKCDTKK